MNRPPDAAAGTDAVRQVPAVAARADTDSGSRTTGVSRGGHSVPRAADEPRRSREPRASRARAWARPRAWAELLRLPALFTVPGDALAGAAAAGARPGYRTLLSIGSSVCLYEAGMVLNDWADRTEDAAERPHRPLPSGRVSASAALTAAGALTGAGLALAAGAGRPAFAVAAPLAATVWAYDLALKHTPAGPVAMAGARALDLLLGAAATAGRTRPALPSAALLGTHTLAVTAVSRRETTGGSTAAPLVALAGTALLTRLVTGRQPTRPPADRREAASRGLPGPTPVIRPAPTDRATGPEALTAVLGAVYAATAARPYLHAALNPSPPLTQRAVGGGIRATIPLQAALATRSGAGAVGLLIAGLAPLGRRCARKVSIT